VRGHDFELDRASVAIHRNHRLTPCKELANRGERSGRRLGGQVVRILASEPAHKVVALSRPYSTRFDAILKGSAPARVSLFSTSLGPRRQGLGYGADESAPGTDYWQRSED
jgi:hypothetical protein